MSIDLDAIEARLEAATPGPWDYIGQGYIVYPGTQYDGCGVPTVWTRIPQCDADADLIAHAPTDLAALLAEVERLRLSIEGHNAEKGVIFKALQERNAENERLRAAAALILHDLRAGEQPMAHDVDALEAALGAGGEG